DDDLPELLTGGECEGEAIAIAEITVRKGGRKMVGKESVHTKTDSAPKLSNSQEACGEGMQPTTQGRQATGGYGANEECKVEEKQQKKKKEEEIMENDDDRKTTKRKERLTGTGGIIGEEGAEHNVWWEREDTMDGCGLAAPTTRESSQSSAVTKYAHHRQGPCVPDRILDWVEKGTTETGKTLRPVSNVPVVPSKWPGRALPCLACFSSMAPGGPLPHSTDWCTYTTNTTATEQGRYVSWWTTD
ncbi:uncharacterized protein BO96DRAFT_347487, partial [Aspergillus niger CBS 101883]